MTTLRQSDLKAWARCPLAWKFSRLDNLPEEQSGSSVFGSVIHDCVLWMEVNQDPRGAVQRFHRLWHQPQLLDPSYRIDYYETGRSWKKFDELGRKVLTDWWSIIQWEADHVLAREHHFVVPVGDGHELEGTADKVALRYHAATSETVLLISDYKTNQKIPTYGYLAEDLQFSAYCYASTRPEFWAGLPHGAEWFQQFEHLSRRGEWVHLQTPRRMDAGPRTQRHYNRVAMAVNAMSESIAMRIFVPTISGETCRYCEFRKPCGLPEFTDTDTEAPGRPTSTTIHPDLTMTTTAITT